MLDRALKNNHLNSPLRKITTRVGKTLKWDMWGMHMGQGRVEAPNRSTPVWWTEWRKNRVEEPLMLKITFCLPGKSCEVDLL